MSRNQTKELLRFLSAFDDEERKLALWLREFIWDLYPQTNELIYDNYNALAVGWSPTDRQGHTFCSIAIGRSSGNIHFGFYWGSKIKDPDNILFGEGNQYRYIYVKDKKTFPKAYITKLIKEAYSYSMSLVKDKNQLQKGLTITKSISSSKRKPGNKYLKNEKTIKKVKEK